MNPSNDVDHRFIKDDYLQQNSFTKYDKYCPFYKSVEMMRNIVTFHRLATAGVEKTASGNSEGQKITYNVIKQRLGDVLYKLTAQKFEDPGGGCGCRAWPLDVIIILHLLQLRARRR